MKIIKETNSLCPECLQVISAEIYEKSGCVYIRKTCPKHGEYEDTYWSDYDQYENARRFTRIGDGLENPRTLTVKGCPSDCGICPKHRSHTILSIIDVTNRCNLQCPICFANSAAAGYLYEPTFEQVFTMLENLASNRPVPVKALQLSGGEPTLRDDLPDIVRKARDLGISHVEVNTNGIRIANNIEYLKKLQEAGVSSFYLQFDGLKPETYKVTRGLNLLPTKMKALDNLRKIRHESTVLVMTLVKGVNDDQLGDVLRFASSNFDIIRCLNVQPVSITGRIEENRLRDYRITIPDFVKLVEEQTDKQIRKEDFYPIPVAVPFARAVGALRGKRYPEFTMHEHCGVATFVFVEDGKLVPITRYADVDAFMNAMDEVYDLAGKGKKLKARFKMLTALKHVRMKVAGELVKGVVKEGSYHALGKLMRKVIMVGSMHFMDLYNFDLERVQRCGIHYAIPDGRIIPFCTMNSLHRAEIEKQFSRQMQPINT